MGLYIVGLKILTLTVNGYECVLNPECACDESVEVEGPFEVPPEGNLLIVIPAANPRSPNSIFISTTGPTPNSTFTLIPPGATSPNSTFPLVNQNVTSPNSVFTLNPNTAPTSPNSVFPPDNQMVVTPNTNFSVFPGQVGDYNLLVQNNHPTDVLSVNSVFLFFKPPQTSPNSLVITATPSGLDANVTFDIGGPPPRFIMVNWGDDTPIRWYNSIFGVTHTYAVGGLFTIVAKIFTQAGAFVEDTTTVEPAQPNEFDEAGTFEWVSPVTGTVTSKNWGGGGNGANGAALASGAGGGGGEYAEGTFAATQGNSYTIVVGGPGQDSTTNGTSVVAKGGGHASGVVEGQGGTGGTGTITHDGGDGFGTLGIIGDGGGGGSSAGPLAAGNPGVDDQGGTAPAGGGDGGDGGLGTGGAPGSPGVAPGGGGGGGSTGSGVGAAGAPGRVELSF